MLSGRRCDLKFDARQAFGVCRAAAGDEMPYKISPHDCLSAVMGRMCCCFCAFYLRK